MIMSYPLFPTTRTTDADLSTDRCIFLYPPPAYGGGKGGKGGGEHRFVGYKTVYFTNHLQICHVYTLHLQRRKANPTLNGETVHASFHSYLCLPPSHGSHHRTHEAIAT